MKKYDYCAYIGRFQPLHMGHYRSIQIALENAKTAIIVIGSANCARDVRNPFTDSERADMIRSAFTDEENQRIKIVTVEDTLYQDHLWLANAQTAINSAINGDGWTDKPPSVAVVGYKKDHTSSYLDSFKHWDSIDTHTYKGNGLDTAEEVEVIHSTDIRSLYFEGRVSFIESVVPKGVYKWMKNFFGSEQYKNLKEEYADRLIELAPYQAVPESHAINAYTADAVVIQSGHILLVKRGKSPGKGLWALPGGHVKPIETSRQASIRELKEETDIGLQPEVLDRAIRDHREFDHPDRSLRYRIKGPRGRTMTMAYLYILNPEKDLPKVRARDYIGGEWNDVSDAWWFPLGDLPALKNQMFEDHPAIINYFIHRHNIS